MKRSHAILAGTAVLIGLVAFNLVGELAAPPPPIATRVPPTVTPQIAMAAAIDQPVEDLPEVLVPRTPIMVTPLATQPATPPSYPDTTPAPDFRSR